MRLGVGEPALKDQPRSMSIDTVVCGAQAHLDLTPCLEAGQALIDQMHAETEAAIQLASEAMDSLAQGFFAIVHIERQPDHGRIRLPFADNGLEPLPVWALPLGANGFECRCCAGHCLTDRHPDLARAEVEAEQGRQGCCRLSVCPGRSGVAGLAAEQVEVDAQQLSRRLPALG